METSASGGQSPQPTNSPSPQNQAPKEATVSADQEPWKQAKHKVKFGGQEREITYDELIRDYQNGKESTRRYQEAARLASEAQSVNQALEKGDVKFLVDKLGPQRARQMFENYLIEQMEYDELPEERKELLSERKRREELERKMKDIEERETRTRQEQLAAQAVAELDAEISDALREAGKKANPRLALRIIEQIEANLKAKGERIPAKEALKYATRSVTEDIGSYLADLSPEEAMSILPKSLIDSLMKAKVDRVLDTRTSARSKPAQAAPRKDDSPMTIEKKFAEMENKFKRKG
jgi:hypothetical protein